MGGVISRLEHAGRAGAERTVAPVVRGDRQDKWLGQGGVSTATEITGGFDTGCGTKRRAKDGSEVILGPKRRGGRSICCGRRRQGRKAESGGRDVSRQSCRVHGWARPEVSSPEWRWLLPCG